jgi:hypothetical protein
MIANFLNSQENNKGKIKIEDSLKALEGEDQQKIIGDAIGQFVQENLSKLVKERKPREIKLKDENAPKKNKSAYLFFSSKMRPQIKAESPEMKVTEISKVIGLKWGELSEKKKAKYQTEAAADKLRYQEEMKGYVRPSDDELMKQKINQKKRRGPKGDKKPRKKKEPGAPKKALSAYMFFVKEKRSEVKAENPEMSTQDIAKEMGRLWKEDFASEEARAAWVEMAQYDKERYAHANAEFLEKKGQVPEEEVAKVPSKKAASKKKSHSNEAGPSNEGLEEGSSDESEKVSKKKKSASAAASSDEVSSDNESQKSSKKKKKGASAASSDEVSSDNESQKSSKKKKKGASAAAAEEVNSDDESQKSSKKKKKGIEMPAFVEAPELDSSDDE